MFGFIGNGHAVHFGVCALRAVLENIDCVARQPSVEREHVAHETTAVALAHLYVVEARGCRGVLLNKREAQRRAASEADVHALRGKRVAVADAVVADDEVERGARTHVHGDAAVHHHRHPCVRHVHHLQRHAARHAVGHVNDNRILRKQLAERVGRVARVEHGERTIIYICMREGCQTCVFRGSAEAHAGWQGRSGGIGGGHIVCHIARPGTQRGHVAVIALLRVVGGRRAFQVQSVVSREGLHDIGIFEALIAETLLAKVVEIRQNIPVAPLAQGGRRVGGQEFALLLVERGILLQGSGCAFYVVGRNAHCAISFLIQSKPFSSIS